MARKRIEALEEPAFLLRVRETAQRCGVTRLAEITGLDRLDLPVWQAIRPASRALSIHQGKGLTVAAAQIGALCEAVESHAAEQVEADGPCCAYEDLASAERLQNPEDLLEDRSRSPDWNIPMQWCETVDLIKGVAVYLPHDFISLDFRTGASSRIERSSNGLGVGADEEGALATALCELIERDALSEWARMGILARVACRIDPNTIPYSWFAQWRERLHEIGASLEVSELPSLAGAPAFRCVIGAGPAFGSGMRRSSGAAAHPEAGTALAKAFAEAAQTRLTLISGARDDLLPRHYAPRPKHLFGTSDDDVEGPSGLPWRDHPLICVDDMIARLSDHGYAQILVKRLDRDLDGVAVVKAFVPGLGMLGRARRVPA